MLTFFRRIRKGLLGEGAASKYLVYAIGEIALVVIGILIALQVNNWNEWRKEQLEEKDTLVLIRNEMQQCLSTLDQRYLPILTSNLKALNEAEIALEVGEIGEPFDFLTTITSSARFGRGQPRLPRTTFEELLNSGKLSLIRNTELRHSIIDHYYFLTEEFERTNDRIEFSGYFATVYKLIPKEIEMRDTFASEIEVKKGLNHETYKRISEAILESDLTQHIIPTRNRYKLINVTWLIAKKRAEGIIALIEAELN